MKAMATKVRVFSEDDEALSAAVDRLNSKLMEAAFEVAGAHPNCQFKVMVDGRWMPIEFGDE